MTINDFAGMVFLHLKQKFNSIDDGSYESKSFNKVYLQALGAICQKSGATEFSQPFAPQKVYDANDEDNPFRQFRYNLYSIPNRLITLLRPDRTGSFSNFIQTAAEDFFPGIQFTTNYTTVYDPGNNIKYIATTSNNPIFLGTFLITNLDLWTPQALETASIYCAWLLAYEINKEKRDRDGLYRDYINSLDQLKIYDQAQKGPRKIIQRSNLTDIIDFDNLDSLQQIFPNLI